MPQVYLHFSDIFAGGISTKPRKTGHFLLPRSRFQDPLSIVEAMNGWRLERGTPTRWLFKKNGRRRHLAPGFR